MNNSFFSRRAITRLQAIIIILIIVVASVAAAAAYVYINRTSTSTQPAEPTPTASAVITPSSSPTPIPTAGIQPTALSFSNLFISPLEAWPGQSVNVSVDVRNTGSENISYDLPLWVNGQVIQTVPLQLAPKASTVASVLFASNDTGNYGVSLGGQSNTLSIVPTGEHTIQVECNHGGIPFTVDGISHQTPYSALVTVGTHTVVTPDTAQLTVTGWGFVTFAFQGWDDGSTDTTRMVNVQNSSVLLVTTYVHQGSCPSLEVWNGTGNSYVADVSDGTGWLGFLEYFNPDGSMVFSNNYPYDYIKLDSTQLEPTNNFYNFTIAELADEIFYLDSAQLVAVDHPAGTQVYPTKSTFVYNLQDLGTLYSVSDNLTLPVSAVNGAGQNVLPLISKLDGNYTPASRWSWNNITLNLGDLTGAQQIKLVVAATTYWPTTQAGGNNFEKYANQPGVMPSPPPYMQVKAPNGTWVNVPEDREFPLPSTNDQEFVVNLTGLFPTNDFELRINYYQQIEFDYIGIDTTTQQNMTIHTILPSTADLEQGFNPISNSTGAFTAYGNVTSLVQSTDNEFIIGRQGDVVTLQFSADLPPVPQGMVRDYFLVTNCWFKGNGLPYVPFTVNPLPFQAMTSFPYPSNETYPYDAEHQAYLQKYNTRIINQP